ncbi:hypothetical protein C2E23DRAFT_11176 [Lenzites betulinus]|nr:hypothetical protein C2E23DRAFT_11176 [Lenzites betulinus]
MEAIPQELVERIFEHACTDGGDTGCALALVSKHVRAMARTTRFHSVALVETPRCFQKFVALYMRECDPAKGDKPRIRHLLMYIPQPPYTHNPSGHVPTQLPGTTSERRKPRLWSKLKQMLPGRSDAKRFSFDAKSYFSEYLEATKTLFHLAAPDLVTLAVQIDFYTAVCGHPSSFPIIERPFPFLREATFVGVDLRVLISEELADALAERPIRPVSATLRPIFPALTHLSLARPVGLFSRFPPAPKFWPTAAPRVTHLCAVNTGTYLASLEDVLGVGFRPTAHLIPDNAPNIIDDAPDTDDASDTDDTPDTDDAPEVLLEPAYPSLQHIVLQPSRGIDGIVKGRIFKQVKGNIRGVGVETRPLRSRSEDAAYPHGRCEALHREWLERIEDDSDAAGCWHHLAVLRGYNPPPPTPPIRGATEFFCGYPLLPCT